MQQSNVSIQPFLIMLFFALCFGFLYSYILSFKMRTSQRLFAVIAMLPAIVGSIITFVNGSIGAGVAIGGAFALIRFRSAPGAADELIAIFTAMTSGEEDRFYVKDAIPAIITKETFEKAQGLMKAKLVKGMVWW